ncbi:MAG: RluA family pseudouridine synthase [Caproiciproducens sp.]|nr:RluA family pseudouridine synthase [Caproiciproducens sp.]
MGKNKGYLRLDGRGSIIQKSDKGGGVLSPPLFKLRRNFMRELSFTVPNEYDGIRLKSFLRGYCSVSSRLMVKLKREPMGIMNNGLHVIATDTLKSGDVIRLLMPDDDKQIEPADLPLQIVYEDKDLLIVDKSANMPMYPCPGHDCDSLANAVAAYYLKQNEKLAFRPVYRLDKDTSGLVVLTKNAYCAACLAGKLQKEYTAICEGELWGNGTIDRPIGLKEGHRIQREVTPNGEMAITKWQALCSGDHHTLLSLELKTGRTHQIRVHLSSLGHPLAGDDMYGGSLCSIGRQALHCGSVSFIHPVTMQGMSFTCNPPCDMQELLIACGMKKCTKTVYRNTPNAYN